MYKHLTDTIRCNDNYIVIDCTEPKQADKVAKKISKYDYTRVPTVSSLCFDYKCRFIVPTDTEMFDTQAGMEHQVRTFFKEVGITNEDVCTSRSYDNTKTFRPCVTDRYDVPQENSLDTFTYGLTVPEALELTHTNTTGLQVTLVNDIPKIYTEPSIRVCRPKRELVEVDASTEPLENNILDRDGAVCFEGKKASPSDVEAMVFETIGKAGTDMVTGFSCPTCNASSFAFIDDVTGCMMIRCTGKDCATTPVAVLSTKYPGLIAASARASFKR